MPYAPGVVDRSGELRAAGKIAMASGIAQGAAEGFRAYQQNTMRNKALQGENNALLAQFMNDPDAKAYAPEGLEKFIEKSIKGGGLSLNDNVTLNGLLNTTIATKNAIQKQKSEAQEQELRKQQMAMNEVQMQEVRRKAAMQAEQQAQLEKLKQFATLSQTNGVLRADVQDGMAERIKQNPFLAAQVQAIQAGAAMDPNTLAQFVTSNQKPQFSEYREDIDGKTYMVRENLRTGQKNIGTIHQPPQPPEVPDPLVRDIYGTLAKERDEKVAPAIASLKAYDEIDRVLKSADGEIISGAFAKPELAVKRMANALGADYKDVADTQKVLALLAVPLGQVIKNFGAGTGLSDADREYAMKAVGGDITLDPKAIKELIRIGKIAAKNIPKQYQSRLDKAFPKDSQDKKYQMARNALEIEMGEALAEEAAAVSTETAPAQLPTWDEVKEKRYQELLGRRNQK